MEDKDYIVLNGDIQQLVSTAQAWHYSIIPKNIINGTVCLLIDENKNPEDVKEELEILLGKNAESNDELMKLYRGKENTLFHTIAPGSPFCVIDNLNPTQKEIQESAIICAAKSQDWRDNKNDVKVNLFKGKDIKKTILMKTGSWKIKSKPEILKIKKIDIENWEKKNVKLKTSF